MKFFKTNNIFLLIFFDVVKNMTYPEFHRVETASWKQGFAPMVILSQPQVRLS